MTLGGFQLTPDGTEFEMKFYWLVSEHKNMKFEMFYFDFNPPIFVLGLMKNGASFLGKNNKLVFLHLDPNTTEPFQIPYRMTLWDLKHTHTSYSQWYNHKTHFYMLFEFAQFWLISSFGLVEPKLIQMHPNDFKFGMEELDGYWGILIHIMNAHPTCF